MNINLRSEMAGKFRLEAFKQDPAGNEIPGSRRVAAEWFPNIITNGGLNRYGTDNDWLNRCQVGSGSTTPAATDTALVSLIGSSTTIFADTAGAQSVSTYYSWRRRTFRFVPGVATGNISEVGVGWSSGGGGLWSRALVLDMGGTPTTITILADETLDVLYEFRNYMSVTDASGTVTLNAVNYDWIARACDVTSVSSWSIPNSAALTGGLAYDGAIAAVTAASPSGTSSLSVSATNTTYVSGSYERIGAVKFGLTNANFGSGIGAVKFNSAGTAWQIGFTPKVPKTSTFEFTLNVKHSWARKTL